MNYLFIINDGPYGSERAYNALRLAVSLQKESQADKTIFMLGDAVVNGLKGQKTTDGNYNIKRVLKAVQ